MLFIYLYCIFFTVCNLPFYSTLFCSKLFVCFFWFNTRQYLFKRCISLMSSISSNFFLYFCKKINLLNQCIELLSVSNCFLYFRLFRIVFAWINEECRIGSKVPRPFKPRFRKFKTGSFRLRIGVISVVGIISVVIGGHFGGGDHFDGGDHFGGGTIACH